MTNEPETNNDGSDEVLAAERARCQAMMTGSREALRGLLHPRLIYVHASGRVDEFESYLAPGAQSIVCRNLERFDDLRIAMLGDTALMTGRQLLEGVRMPSGDPVRMMSQVMQVWRREHGRWLQVAFQATPLVQAPADARLPAPGGPRPG